jgi:ribonuclease J
MAGVPIEEDREQFIDEAVEAAAGAARKGAKDAEKLREAIRLAVRRIATEWTGKKPVVNVSLMEV